MFKLQFLDSVRCGVSLLSEQAGQILYKNICNGMMLGSFYGNFGQEDSWSNNII